MIIKSLSRKSTSFTQLYDYMNQAQNMGDGLTWNLLATNRSHVLHSFYQNASLLRSHAKGNALYHEIISLKQCSSASLDRQKKALYDIAHKYLASRGKDLLGYGRTHIENGHIHMHLMLSSNELNQSKRHRLSKAEFREIQMQCEQYILQTYPDLEQEAVYTKVHQKAVAQVSNPTLDRSSSMTTKPSLSSRRKELDELNEYYQQTNRNLDSPEL